MKRMEVESFPCETSWFVYYVYYIVYEYYDEIQNWYVNSRNLEREVTLFWLIYNAQLLNT